MKTLAKPIIIFSVDTGCPIDAKMREHVLNELERLNIGFGRLSGCYKGNREQSFMVVDSERSRAFVDRVTKMAQQESVLFVDQDAKATLHYLDNGIEEFIGTFKAVSEDEAKQKDAWTYSLSLNQYYIAE